MPMEIINNIDKTLKDDLLATIRDGSRLSIAASCFSLYALLCAPLPNLAASANSIPK